MKSTLNLLILSAFLLNILFACGDRDYLSGLLPVYMWESTTVVGDGDFGGVDAADAICKTDAPASMAKKTHKAVIATSTYDPRTIVNGSRPVQRTDGTLLISRYSDFFDPSKKAKNSLESNNIYWIGLDSSGDVSTTNCSNWTTTLGTGDVGIGNDTKTHRFRYNSLSCTFSSGRILCLSY